MSKVHKEDVGKTTEGKQEKAGERTQTNREERATEMDLLPLLFALCSLRLSIGSKNLLLETRAVCIYVNGEADTKEW